MHTPSIHQQTLSQQTARLVNLLQAKRPQFLSTWYLSGDTSLSLQLGHRESEDLDFFSKKVFDPVELQKQLEFFGRLESVELAKGTLNAYLGGVKIQFLEYPYPLLKPVVNWKSIGLSSVIDIAGTKLQTVRMRGSKKDFVDIYFLLDQFSLAEMFEAVHRKYTGSDYNRMHMLKSLVYFDDANDQPMPRMHKTITWGRNKAEND